MLTIPIPERTTVTYLSGGYIENDHFTPVNEDWMFIAEKNPGKGISVATGEAEAPKVQVLRKKKWIDIDSLK